MFGRNARNAYPAADARISEILLYAANGIDPIVIAQVQDLLSRPKQENTEVFWMIKTVITASAQKVQIPFDTHLAATRIMNNFGRADEIDFDRYRSNPVLTNAA